jgi:hypothetical protein
VGSGPTNAIMGAQAKGNPEKKLKPLFTNGSAQKRTQGKSLWNQDGTKYFHRVEKNGGRFMMGPRGAIYSYCFIGALQSFVAVKFDVAWSSE